MFDGCSSSNLQFKVDGANVVRRNAFKPVKQSVEAQA
jgi:hypothetical protein